VADVAEIVIRATDQASATIDKSAEAVSRMQVALAKSGAQATKSSSSVLSTNVAIGKLGTSLNVLVNGPLSAVAPSLGAVGEHAVAAGSALAAIPSAAKAIGVAFTTLLANPIVLAGAALAGLVVGMKAWLDTGEKVIATNAVIGDSYRKDVTAVLADASAQFQQQFDDIGRLQDISKGAADAAKAIADPFKQLVAQNTLAKAGVGFDALALAGSQAFGLLGDTAGKLLGADGKLNTELGKNLDATLNSAAERLGRLDEQVGPGTVESIGKLSARIADALHLTAADIATASLKPGGIRDAMLEAYQQADPLTRKIVDDLRRDVPSTMNDTALALQPIGFAMANYLTDPLVAKVNMLQQALANLVNTVSAAGASSSTVVTGSVGSGGGSPGGGPIPGGIGGGPIVVTSGGSGGTGGVPTTTGGSGSGGGVVITSSPPPGGSKSNFGGTGGGGGFSNFGSFSLHFAGVTNSHEVLHVMDVLAGQ
jgi:hypothetical protein